MITLETIKKDWNKYREKMRLKTQINEEYTIVYGAEFTRISYGWDEEDGYYDIGIHFKSEERYYTFAFSFIRNENYGFLIQYDHITNKTLKRPHFAEKLFNHFFKTYYEETFKEYEKKKVNFNDPS